MSGEPREGVKDLWTRVENSTRPTFRTFQLYLSACSLRARSDMGGGIRVAHLADEKAATAVITVLSKYIPNNLVCLLSNKTILRILKQCTLVISDVEVLSNRARLMSLSMAMSSSA
jgi:hypothetical protein